MSKSSTWLLDFKSDVYSQTGEDGIIQKILEILPENDKWCVEFGAWDGKHVSNTRNLIENHDYSAVLIEANERKYGDLVSNYSGSDNIYPVNQFVGFKEEDSLDSILEDLPIPIDFDFLSVDIDGNDYHVLKAISKYKPKVICVEFNPTVPTEISFIQKADPTVSQGSSLLAFIELAKEQGYELVSVMFFNAIFVKKEYFSLFEIVDNSPETLRTNLSLITHIYIGYDGTVFVEGNKMLPWHGIGLKTSKFQHLPSYLRKFSGNYNKLEGFLFKVFVLFRYPVFAFGRIKNKFTRKKNKTHNV